MGYFIYEILNTINGKRYIGCTKNTEKRFSQHRRALDANKHKNGYLQNAYNKYGSDNFQYNIIIVFNSEDDMYLNERKMISESDHIYNLTEGGLGGDTFTNRSEESKAITRERLSKASKINNEKNKSLHSENTTKLWKNDEYRKKVLKGVRENAKKPEYREKLSKGVKKALENPDIRQKWSDCKKGKNNGRWKGSLIIFKGGKILEVHESIMGASKATGINRDTISRKTKDGKSYNNKNSKYNGCTFKLSKYQVSKI